MVRDGRITPVVLEAGVRAFKPEAVVSLSTGVKKPRRGARTAAE